MTAPVAPMVEEPMADPGADAAFAPETAVQAIDSGLESLRAETDQITPATSIEVTERPTEEETFLASRGELDLPELNPEIEQSLITLYGADFPLLNPDADEEEWVRWVDNRWINLGPTVQRRLWLVERNRLFRNGVQWISSAGFGPWREPPRPREAARVVENVIAPALDQRIQILTEQRPGFQVRPTTNDPDARKKAEAKQYALEYQYDQQEMVGIIKEAEYWAGTDGVAFLESYWDPDAGPWHEMYYEQAAMGGQEQMSPGQPGSPRQEPVGDVKTRVRRIEQVRVSAEATANKKPWFWIIKDVMSKAEAVRLYGTDIAKEPVGPDPSTPMFQNFPQLRMGYQLPNIDELLLEQEKIIRYTVYIEKSLGLPKGLTLLTVGNKLVLKDPLTIGCVPLVRFTDGSTDPAFFPAPEMEKWIDSQMRINAVKSKWVENVRMNSGARLLAKENAIATETYTAANMSIVSAKGLGPLNDIVRPMEAFSVGNDAKELLSLERKQFEDLSGWNDVSRGQFDQEQSGRAILAIRDQLERIFSPMINAASLAMSQWGKLTCGFMAYGYDFPRFLAIEGKGRPDLARAVMSDDMDGVADIFVDPETLMPLPRPLRLFLLKDMFQSGLMDAKEYRRRLPFAYTRQIQTPDEDQDARAKRVCEMLKMGQWPEILWQDNEAIHQDVLERELILPDDTDPQLRMMAQQRWMLLAQQQQMKMGMVPMGAGMAPGAPPTGGLSAVEQPSAATNPGIAADQQGMADEDRSARQFDSQQRSMDQQ